MCSITRHLLAKIQSPILSGGNRPQVHAPRSRLTSAICALAVVALGIGIANSPIAKAALTASALTVKALCLAHPLSASIIGGVIAVAVIIAVVVAIVKQIKHQNLLRTHASQSYQTLCTDLNKQLLDIARGWHDQEEVEAQTAKQSNFVCSHFGGQVLTIQTQGYNDILRENVTVGNRPFPLPQALLELPVLSQEQRDRVSRQRHEKRVLDILLGVQTLFDDPRLSKKHAAEVMTLLCAQTVVAPLEAALMELHCKDSAGNVTKVLCASTNIPRVHSVAINAQNEVVFVSEVSYETHAFDNPEGPVQNAITIRVETRIAKETLLSKSMEELQPHECTFNYQIKKI